MTRSALVGELLSHVRAGKTYGALLVGDTGFGKTRVLNALRTILAAEYEVIQLFPSRSLTPLPFGTVAAIIGHGEGSAITFHEALATIMGRIRETAHQGRRTLIVIDNASLVDQESSAVIAQAVLAGNCQVIMAQRNLSRETALTQLWRDGLLTRFQVGPLTQNEGFDLILSMTGGRLSHGAGNYLLRRAGGSAMALSGLVAGALEEGSLRCDDGWWVLDHPTGRYGGELTEIINADLAAMNPAERKIIELVALAGRVRLCDLNKLVNSAALDALQESGQLKIDASGEPIVQMANRAHSGMIRQLVPIGRSQSYRHELAQVYDPWKTKDFKGKIRDVTWGLDCGILPSDQKLIIAARMANHELYSDDALRIATAAVDGPLRAAALAEQAQALVYHNDYLQAEQLGIAALEIATSAVDGLRALTATLHAQLPSKDGEEKLERVERLYFDRFPEAAESNSGIAQASRIVLAMAHLSLGHLDAARESFEKLLAAPADLSPVAEAMASVSLSEILSETGDVLAASGMARAALAAIGRQRHVSPHTAIYILTRSAVNFLNEGDFASARHLLHREEPENYSIELPIGGLKHLGIGIAFIHEGRLAEAAEELTAAAASLRGYDP
ncbi:hypothetical protein ACQQCD_05440 [Pseudarthrobacter sp. J1763]|uniref:hypothetical protein n=1 Tax=Pseudarthrobacter sp. J1763 TaxID=3420445 RepID=UPI003D286C45